MGEFRRAAAPQTGHHSRVTPPVELDRAAAGIESCSLLEPLGLRVYPDAGHVTLECNFPEPPGLCVYPGPINGEPTLRTLSRQTGEGTEVTLLITPVLARS
ncbi:hypothetical protein DPEC_G00358660 [Dallia pectoralis]|uniref:Uncharacterized protein n=1 Tax=Dallia pectoralis TaxID=75939 RepID=A0ACC2F0E4_DALPE|nr:hypothetical protein DPEC_G00358660 [Dallia pectoralis]